MPEKSASPLSPLGHPISADCWNTPWRHRFRHADRQWLSPLPANSLAPDRAAWAYDHRGVMVRVLGGAERSGDAAGKPHRRAHRPIPISSSLSQIVAGLAGIDAKLDPRPQDVEPYVAERPMLPKSLPAALDALDTGAAVPQRVRRHLRRLFRRAEAHRAWPVPLLQERGLKPTTNRRDGNRTSISTSSERRAPTRSPLQ